MFEMNWNDQKMTKNNPNTTQKWPKPAASLPSSPWEAGSLRLVSLPGLEGLAAPATTPPRRHLHQHPRRGLLILTKWQMAMGHGTVVPKCEQNRWDLWMWITTQIWHHFDPWPYIKFRNIWNKSVNLWSKMIKHDQNLWKNKYRTPFFGWDWVNHPHQQIRVGRSILIASDENSSSMEWLLKDKDMYTYYYGKL